MRAADGRRHYCLAFEKLGPSLYSALKAVRTLNETGGGSGARGGSGGGSSGSRSGVNCCFTLQQIACVAADCFRALAHMHSIALTHTDLKPENVLFVVRPRAVPLPQRASHALLEHRSRTGNVLTAALHRRDLDPSHRTAARTIVRCASGAHCARACAWAC